MIKELKEFLFINRTTRQTVAKNTFWLSVSSIGGRLIRALIIVYAARVLGANGWGYFSYAITLVGFLTMFMDMGINSLLTRDSARSDNSTLRSQIISTSLVIKCVLLSLGVIVVIFVAPMLTTLEGAKSLFPIIAFVLVFDTLREFGSSIIRAIERMEWEAGIFIATNIAIVVAGFVFLRIHPSAKAFTLAYALGTGVGTVATLFMLRSYLKGIFSYFSPQLVKQILASAWPIAISGFLIALLTNTDILVIGWLRSAQDVGLYSAAIRILQIFFLFPSIISSSTLPMFSRASEQSKERFRTVLETTLGTTFLLAIPLAIGGFILGEHMMEFVFGGAYAAGGLSLQVLMLTALTGIPAGILVNAVFVYGGQKKLTIYFGIAGITNVILDLVLIPRFGITGSAWATLASQALSYAYLSLTMKHINDFHVFSYLKKIIFATAAMSLITLSLTMLGMHVVGVILISVAAYFTLLFVQKEQLLREIMLILAPMIRRNKNSNANTQ